MQLPTSTVCMSERARDNFKEGCTVERHFSSIIFFCSVLKLSIFKTFPEQERGHFPVISLVHLLFVENIVFLQKADVLYGVSPPNITTHPPLRNQEDMLG